MNKIIYLFILIILTGCSLNKNSKFWSTSETINEDTDRQRLYESAVSLYKDIQDKYDAYGISEKPLLFLKSDYGTYGMGVMAIEDPE